MSKLKNKAEREQFLENYRNWELWKEIPELELKFYRFIIESTGAAIIATEHSIMKYSGFRRNAEYTKGRSVKYHLLLKDGDKSYSVEYDPNAHRLYNPSGDSKTSIIDYLTKVKPEV